MRLRDTTWRKYQIAHSVLQDKAKRLLREYFDTLPWETDEAQSIDLLCQRAIALVNRYGLADGELSAEFYDELMSMQGANVQPAEIAKIDNSRINQQTREAVKSGTSLETSKLLASSVVAGHVKQVGLDTTLSAAQRDKAMWAWVCIGDTCAFCRVLGSNGWQEASKKMQKGQHAQHVHDNCDCQIVVKPAGASLEVDGYDPDALRDEYKNADGISSKQKINSMRRESYTPEFAAERNARRRELYAIAKEERERGEDANTD